MAVVAKAATVHAVRDGMHPVVKVAVTVAAKAVRVVDAADAVAVSAKAKASANAWIPTGCRWWQMPVHKLTIRVCPMTTVATSNVPIVRHATDGVGAVNARNAANVRNAVTALITRNGVIIAVSTRPKGAAPVSPAGRVAGMARRLLASAADSRRLPRVPRPEPRTS